MQSIGKHIRQLREYSGRTLREAAGFLNITPDHLNNIEQGRIHATKTQVFQLASYFEADESKMLAAYLKHRLAQLDPTKVSSKRVENISYELEQLQTRRIKARIHKPTPPLGSVIENMIYYNGNSKVHPFERVFPDGSVQLIIELEGNEKRLMAGNGTSSVPLKKTWIEGVQKQYTTYWLDRNEKTLAIKFTPGGFYTLTNISATEVKDCFIDAELIFGTSILSLRERLSDFADADSIFREAEEYFSGPITSLNEEASLVQYLINNIDTPISELAEKTGFSHKHVIRLFKKHTGISPKYLQRIFRFNGALQNILSTAREVDWSDIVFNNGYYDQSHFIKEFKHFAGISPGEYLETGSTCSQLLHLSEYR